MLAPPEGLRAPELPGVNPGGRPQESGGDSKAIYAEKKFCDERTDGRTYGRTDVTVEILVWNISIIAKKDMVVISSARHKKCNTVRKFGSFLARVKNGGVLEMAYHACFADEVCFANFNLKGGKMGGDTSLKSP